MQRLVLLSACLLLAVPTCGLAQSRAPVVSESGESRTALVIGNASYKDAPLANPVNDARAVARTLTESGFQVKLHVNLTQAQMRRVIREFGDELHAKQGVGLFYFAGHGVQLSNRNFLIPVGADIQREYEVEDQAVDASAVLAMMESAKARVNIVVLDACRNNPFMRNFRSTVNGLAPMQAPSGTLVAFSTAPGQTAIDGVGQMGLYTEHLVENLALPGLKIEDVFKNVRVGVQRASNGRQVPWENTSLTGDFYFKAPLATVAQAGATAADVDKAIQGAFRRREEEETARRTAQQSEIERAVLTALRRREEEQAAAQLARAEKENQEAKVAIDRLNRELAELRAAREAAPPPPVAAPAPAPAAPQVSRAPQPPAAAPQVTRSPQPSATPPTQVALATPSAPRAAPTATAGGRVERPDVRAGDRWKYQVTEGFSGTKHAAIVEVASVTESVIYTQTSRTTLATTGIAPTGGTVDAWDRDWNQLRRGDQEFTPNYPWLQFPLEQGKTWSARARHSAANMIATTFQLAAKVDGWERVTVPAGTFDAVKITWTGTFTGEKEFDSTVGISSGNVTNVIWYAPAVRQAVKKEIRMQDFNIRASQSMSERWELLEYQVDGAESPASPAAATQVARAPQPSSPPATQVALAQPSAPRAAPAATAGGRAERPDVRAGDRWKYQVTEGFSGRKHAAIIEVASVTESMIYTQTSRTTLAATGLPATAGVVDVWDRDWNQLRHGEQDYAPFYPWLQFPLEQGKTWSARARHSAANMIATTFQLAAKVDGWERVTVPAGTFDAVKITWTGTFTGEKEFDSTVGISSGNVTNVIWYAPAVRQAVKKEIRMQDFNIRASQSMSERWELLEYKAD